MTESTINLINGVLKALISNRQLAQNIAYDTTSLIQALAQHKLDLEEAEKKRGQSSLSDESVPDAEHGRLSTAK
jgi:hypothetical protein